MAADAYALPLEARLLLPERPVLLDLGANVGLFGRIMLDKLDTVQLIGYEPDPANAHVLRHTLRTEISAGIYKLEIAAAGAIDGTARLAAGLGGCSRIDEAGTLSVAMLDVLPVMAAVDMVKIDIEGGEWPILADHRLRDAANVLALEFHPHGCPNDDPESLARDLLQRAGYRIVSPPRPFSPDEFPAGQGMLWAVRTVNPASGLAGQ